MNGFYIANKNLKWASNLDSICLFSWVTLFFIIFIYHFCYLLPNYGGLQNGGSSNATSNYISTYISTNGYSGFFKTKLINFIIFEFSLWHLVLILFLVILFTFIGKVILGSSALYWFIKAGSIRHIYAAIAVVFMPFLGGIVASNIYGATNSSLDARYVAPFSSIRARIKKFVNNRLENANK